MNYFLTLIGTAFLFIGIVAPISINVHMSRLMLLSAASFVSVGAYTYSLLAIHGEASFVVGVIAAAIAGWLSGIIAGIFIAHLTDEIFGIATLCLQVIIWQILINWDALTRGPLGLAGIPGIVILGCDLTSPLMKALILGVYAITSVALCTIVGRSYWGYALRASASDETLLISFGTNSTVTKRNLMAFSGILFGIGGACYAAYYSYVDPGTFSLSVAVAWFSMAIIGRGPIWLKPLTGVFVYLGIEESLRWIGLPDRYIGWGRQAIFGMLVIIAVSRWRQISQHVRKENIDSS